MEELLRRTIGETIELEIVAAGGLWATFCDPHQLESAMLNLAINARDAMPDGGKLDDRDRELRISTSVYAAEHARRRARRLCLPVASPTPASA